MFRTRLTTAYSRKEHDVVERVNKEVIRHLCSIMSETTYMSNGHLQTLSKNK